MAIEGPLREMGIHDVFQLLDLSRKTGVLKVRSEIRKNVGTVHFREGSVIFAELASNPHRLGELLLKSGHISQDEFDRSRELQEEGDARRIGAILVATGAIVPSDLERHVTEQVEEVVFEMLSWREGRFAFTEGALPEHPWESTVRITTDQLLMEGARRIDEWSRIQNKIPDASVIPRFATTAVQDDFTLELLPGEWDVLSMVDGSRDARMIAAALSRSVFDVGRILFGLESTGLLTFEEEIRQTDDYAAVEVDEIVAAVERAAASESTETALEMVNAAIAERPSEGVLHLVRGRLCRDMKQPAAAEGHFREALRCDPLLGPAHRELGEALAVQGKYAESLQWLERWLATGSFTAAEPEEVAWVEKAVRSARDLNSLLRDDN